MKKLLLLFIGCSVASCSNDENSSSDPTDFTLPKTISYVYPSPQLGTNSKATLTFNGNKIVSSIDEDSKTLFTYTGDLITKQEVFDLNLQGKETKTKELVYTYENGKIKTRMFHEDISAQYPDGEFIEKTVYTHTSNEVISYINYSVNVNTKAEVKTDEGKYTYKDGNLIKNERTITSGTSTRTYEYDSKNNPLKNILGFNLLLNEISEFGKNNVVKETVSGNDGTFSYLTSYIYNNSDYPTRHTSYSSDASIEYEIEYTY